LASFLAQEPEWELADYVIVFGPLQRGPFHCRLPIGECRFNSSHDEMRLTAVGVGWSTIAILAIANPQSAFKSPCFAFQPQIAMIDASTEGEAFSG